MTTTYISNNYISLDPLTLNGLTLEELNDMHDKLVLELDDIKTQLDVAVAKRRASGEFADPEWFAKATIAKRCRGRRIQQIQRRMSILNKEAKAASIDSGMAQVFVDVAREALPEEVFNKLLMVAMQAQG